MHYFFNALRKYWVFSGRASRREFWLFTLFYLVVLVSMVAIDILLGAFNAGIGFGLLSGIFFIATLPPSIGVQVRRLHDSGHSGWWWLLGLAPYIGWFALMVLSVFSSQPGDNAYGPQLGDGLTSRHTTPALSGMARWSTYALKSVLILGVVMIAVGMVRLAWLRLSNDLLAASQAAKEDSHHDAQPTAESRCLDQALDRQSADSSGSIDSNVLNTVSLAACLDSSLSEPSFCDGVPEPGQMLAMVAWSSIQCVAHQASDDFRCSNLMQAVARYCASAAHADKSVPSAPTESVLDALMSPDALVAGQDQVFWAERWWQWASALDRHESPVADETGARCAFGQAGDVWFLAGTYGSGKTSRTCHVPAGKFLFFPLYNFVLHRHGKSPDGCVRSIQRLNDLTSDARALMLSVDDQTGSGLDRHRMASVECFNLYIRRDETPYESAAMSGYYVALRPLPTGTHTVEFGGGSGDNRQAVSYTLIVD